MKTVSAPSLWIHQDGQHADVRVVGRGTFQNATLLKDTCQRLQSLGLTRLTINLHECETMDSTFLGVLAGAALRFRRAGGEVTLTHVTGRKMELVENMCLDRLLTVRGADGPEPVTGFDPVAGPVPDQVALSRTVLDAHETLSQLSEDNRRKFKDVVDFLRTELAATAPGK
jgi:anti-anti-sigma regulatory factor